MTTGAGKIAGVMGWPVAHSLSPLLHSHWLAELGIDGALVPLKVAPEDFSLVLEGLRRAGFSGVNVTVPHKQAAFALAYAADAAAQAAGAANLLVFEGSRILARNTDALGLEESLREALGDSLHGKKTVLLGAGGAARGAILALAELGVCDIRILSRKPGRAQALAATMAASVAPARLAATGFDAWPDAAADATLLLNATSAGMKGQAPLDLPLEPLPPVAVVCDIVYNPLLTDLLRRARARGHVTIDGLGMLMHQAVPSFEAFFGVRPKVSVALRAALEKALA